MVIGFDGSRAFDKNKTGTENYSYHLLNSLVKADTHNRYLVYLRPGTKIKSGDWPSQVKFKVLNFHRLWTQLGLALQTFKDPLDLLFVPGHTLPLIRRPRLKTVMTVHDLGAEYLPTTHQLKQRLYLRFITSFQLKSASRLIAVSKATKQDLLDKVKIPSKHIKVVYEGLSFNQSKELQADTKDRILKHYNIKNNDYFLFVGTIQPRKNLYNLISAYGSYFGPFHRAPKLILAGGKGWLSDEIYLLPQALGLKNRVKFLGRVPDEDLPTLYSHAIALVYPSLYEGFGLPILEAFECGCPVVTSNLSSMPEVGGEAAIYVDPLSTSDIGHALGKLLIWRDLKVKTEVCERSRCFRVNAKLRRRLIKQGRQQLKKFSWDKAARETLTVLEEAARDK